MRFSSITGVVSTEEKVRFERMIFRATRGNCYVRFAPIKQPITDPETGALVEKCVFIIFFKSLSIETKLKKICDAFFAHRYSLPDMDDAPAVDRMLTENAQELVDSRTVLLKNSLSVYGQTEDFNNAVFSLGEVNNESKISSKSSKSGRRRELESSNSES